MEKRQRDYLKCINDLDQKINKLVAQQLEIKELVQQEDTMKERSTELSLLNDMIQTELEELKQQLKPAFEKKRKAEVALDTLKETHKQKLAQVENKVGHAMLRHFQNLLRIIPSLSVQFKFTSSRNKKLKRVSESSLKQRKLLMV